MRPQHNILIFNNCFIGSRGSGLGHGLPVGHYDGPPHRQPQRGRAPNLRGGRLEASPGHGRGRAEAPRLLRRLHGRTDRGFLSGAHLHGQTG